MFVELVDQLRCPREHRETWLVASADRVEGRSIVSGLLGCPVCRAEFPIERGVADFRTARDVPREAADARAADAGQAMRLAALLDLADGTGYAVLWGTWAIQATAVQSLVTTHLLLVNAPAGTAAGAGASAIAIDDALPLASGSARAVALDATATPARAITALNALVSGGRLVAPVSLAVPEGVTELARDAELWVGMKEAAPGAVVELRRGSRTARSH
jgi:hypothetical protein